MSTVHIIGAGVSGLACATHAVNAGLDVTVYEAASHAGGRARSFHDESLDCVIDNGNHLLLGGNKATRAYLANIGAENAIREISPAVFPFLDLKSGKRWWIRPGRNFPPMWLFSASRRVPDTRPVEYFAQINRLRNADNGDTVAQAVGTESKLYRNLWQPMCTATLNTDPTEASAALMWRVVRETFLRGEKSCRPWYFHKGLSAALVYPAQEFLAGHGAQIRFNTRLNEIHRIGNQVTSLTFSEGTLPVSPNDSVVLALSPGACSKILPDVKAPTDSRTIVNAHFRLDQPQSLSWDIPFLGLINAETHWIFVRDNIVSITVSAADAMADEPNWEIATKLWTEAATVLRVTAGRPPPWRIIKERRATYTQSPSQVNSRPGVATSLNNLYLAGDWTDTGLPATIEGSITSGFRAATMAAAGFKAPFKSI
ncbi:MAG: hydroxysqualene dehydroxylase HpnE [Pseudomonadota bacterium]|nr:hydroxysqualene dehydroxylase HpnE [Pseudomonadota bacterium]